MSEPFQSLDRISLTAPFGIRFRDTASRSFVSKGLHVTIIRDDNPEKRIEAAANRSGIFVVNHLPGFKEFENRAGDSDVWLSPPGPKTFKVEVRDLERRFQPFRLNVVLPTKGLFEWRSPLCQSPPTPSRSVPLYSSASRPAPPGMAAIRADLWDAKHDKAASWAVAEAYLGEELLARGIADADGRLAMIFPYPSPQRFPVSSPISSPLSSPLGDRVVATGLPLTRQQWNLQLRFLYSPGSLDSPLSPLSPPDQMEPPEQLPELDKILRQHEAHAFEDFAQGIDLPEQPLSYGAEVPLKSKDSISQPPMNRTLHQNSVLFITPAV